MLKSALIFSLGVVAHSWKLEKIDDGQIDFAQIGAGLKIQSFFEESMAQEDGEAEELNDNDEDWDVWSALP